MKGLKIRAGFKDFKSVQKDQKQEQGFEIAAKRFQIGAEITNRGNINFKLGQGLQIGAEQILLFKFNSSITL